MTQKILLAFLSLALAGCATTSQSEVASVDKDVYLVVSHSIAEVQGARLLVSLYKTASIHCNAQGKQFEKVSERTTDYSWLTYATAELRFRCR